MLETGAQKAESVNLDSKRLTWVSRGAAIGEVQGAAPNVSLAPDVVSTFDVANAPTVMTSY